MYRELTIEGYPFIEYIFKVIRIFFIAILIYNTKLSLDNIDRNNITNNRLLFTLVL